MPNFVVVTAFRSKDQMSADLRKMGLSAKNFGRVSGLAFKKAEHSALSLKKVIGGVLGAAVIRRGLGLLTQGVGGVVSEFIDFDDAIMGAAAKFGVFDRESQTFKDLAKTARDVGAITEFTSPQAAEGLRFLAKAGWETGAAMKALPSFVNLATASEMEFARAADIATDVMGAFGLNSTDAAEKVRNLTRVNDVLSRAVNMSNIDMEDLFETMKMAGPIATTAGISLEKFSAMAAYVGGAGIKGSLGGTALRTMFLNLAAPTDKIKAKFKSLGIRLQTIKGDLRDPVKILVELSKKFKNLGSAQKAAALNLIFGKRAVSGAAVSMDGASGALQQFEKTLTDAGGSSKKMAEFMRQSLSKRLETLKSAAIELGFKVMDTFSKKFPGGIDAAVEAVRNFDAQRIVDGINSVIDAGKTFVSWMKEAKQIATDYKGVLVGIGVAFAGWKLAGIISGLVQIVKFMAALKAVGGLTTVLAAAGVAPILGVIGLALGGIAAGVYTVVTRWDELKWAVGEAVDMIGSWLSELGQSIAGTFASIWQSIKSGFADVLDWIVSGAESLGVGSLLDLSGVKNFSKSLREVKKSEKELENQGEYKTKPLVDPQSAAAPLATRKALEEAQIKSNLKNLTLPPSKAAAKMTKGAKKSMRVPNVTIPTMDVYAPTTKPIERAPALDFNAPVRTDEKLKRHVKQRERARAQAIEFNGRLDIAGAPAGSQITSKTRGAPPIRTEMLGANH